MLKTAGKIVLRVVVNDVLVVDLLVKVYVEDPVVMLARILVTQSV